MPMKRSKGVASQHCTRRAQGKALHHKAPAAIASEAARVTAERWERASAETFTHIYIYIDFKSNVITPCLKLRILNQVTPPHSKKITKPSFNG